MEDFHDSIDNWSVYYFHKISISCYQHATTLNMMLRHEEIKIRPILPKDRGPIPYQSCIEIVNPSEACLNYLAENRHIIRQCKISYIELARDTIFQSFHTADLFLRNLSKTLRKKYSGGSEFDGTTREKNPGKGLYADFTFYFGTVTQKKEKKTTDEKKDFDITGAFKFVMYPKDSPINGLPCAHMEWRIVHAYNIQKKTGIKTIEDLLTINRTKVFDNLASQYLTHSMIDYDKLGMWILNLKKCRKPSKDVQRSAWKQGTLFCEAYHIKTAYDLISFFMIKKKRIKSKLGRKSNSEQRILLLNCNRFLLKKSGDGSL